MKHIQLLAAKAAVVAALAASVIVPPARAGIPVLVDGGVNTLQTLISTIEEIAQTAKQIEEYKTQLDQYQNMLQNTMNPDTYIWDQAQVTISKLLQATDTLNYYKAKLGSLDSYLGKFQDVAYYRNSPCFTSAGCSPAERAAMLQNRTLASESQKKANDALFRGLDKQQTNLQSDASTLRSLQSAAQGASGQMQALGYANQLASQQANQLLQIRSLLIAQQNAIGTQMQGQTDREAQTQAAHTTSTESRIGKSANPKNWLELTR